MRPDGDGDRDKEENEDEDCIPGIPRNVVPSAPPGALPRGRRGGGKGGENKEEEEDEKDGDPRRSSCPPRQPELPPSPPPRASPIAVGSRGAREAQRSEMRRRTRRGIVRANVAHLSKKG